VWKESTPNKKNPKHDDSGESSFAESKKTSLKEMDSTVRWDDENCPVCGECNTRLDVQPSPFGTTAYYCGNKECINYEQIIPDEEIIAARPSNAAPSSSSVKTPALPASRIPAQTASKAPSKTPPQSILHGMTQMTGKDVDAIIAQARQEPDPAKANALRQQALSMMSQEESKKRNNLKESYPSTGETSVQAAARAQTKSNSMELNELKGRIATLESLDTSKLTPTRFAESLTQIEELHQEVANFAAADPKRAWDGTKLHQKLETVANRFNESAQAPVKQARKLGENNTKLMKVINAVAQTALTYKKQLGESIKGSAASLQLKEELTRRGQGWRKVAESRQNKLQVLERDFNDSCEALDIMAKRYHADTTDLARKVIALEFKEKSAHPAIQKALKEATRLRHIAAIREMCEGKRPLPTLSEEGSKAAGVGKPADGETPKQACKKGDKKNEKGECVAEEPGKVTNEAKTEVTESKESGAKLVFSTRDPRAVNESIDLVQRLSKATA
jgi:hypothetical protein